MCSLIFSAILKEGSILPILHMRKPRLRNHVSFSMSTGTGNKFNFGCSQFKRDILLETSNSNWEKQVWSLVDRIGLNETGLENPVHIDDC